MASVADTFNTAWQYHQQGRFQAAEQLYRQVLEMDPSHVDAWCFLGAACQAQGNLAGAESNLRRAVQLMPGHPCAQNHLGIVLVQEGKLTEAEANFQQFVLSQPEDADAFNNLGLVQAQLGQFDQAVASYERALRIRPDFSPARGNLQQALQRQVSKGAGVNISVRAETESPADKAHAANLRGVACAQQGQYEQATIHFQEAIALQPENGEALNNLAIVLAMQEKHDEAIIFYRRAIRCNPQLAEAWNNLANALMRLDKFEEATDAYRQALKINPGYAEAWTHIGIANVQQGKLPEALAAYDKALKVAPQHADTRLYRSLVWLLQGKWAEGWPEYEWRWQTGAFTRYSFAQPRWDGSSLEGRTILLLNEQGLGDTLQFIRYARLFKRCGARVVVRCQAALESLLRHAEGIDELVPLGSTLPRFDTWAPLLSVPGILKTSVDTIPGDAQYLHADAKLEDYWRQELQSLKGFKIGIAWQGNPAVRDDHHRSFALANFASLARLKNVHLISLQKGFGTDQLREAAFPVLDLSSRLDEGAGAFMDTAAVMKNVDLVISSDTAIAHLAGGLGVPVWLALPLSPDWRWLLQREDSSWYPTMRLFRQNRLGDWQDVFQRMADALNGLITQKSKD